jgi:hypothetical protein
VKLRDSALFTKGLLAPPSDIANNFTIKKAAVRFGISVAALCDSWEQAALTQATLLDVRKKRYTLNKAQRGARRRTSYGIFVPRSLKNAS